MEDLLTEILPFIVGLVSVLAAYLLWKRLGSTKQEESEEIKEGNC